MVSILVSQDEDHACVYGHRHPSQAGCRKWCPAFSGSGEMTGREAEHIIPWCVQQVTDNMDTNA